MNVSHSSDFSHHEVIHLYGLFMVAWSVADGVVQAALMKELNLSSIKAQIVTTSMQFRQRTSILCSLLGLHGERHRDAIRLLQKIEKNARRNMLVHGHIVVGVPGELTFVKCSATEDAGFKSKKASFTAESLKRHINLLTGSTNRLQIFLEVTDNDIQQLADVALVASE